MKERKLTNATFFLELEFQFNYFNNLNSVLLEIYFSNHTGTQIHTPINVLKP